MQKFVAFFSNTKMFLNDLENWKMQLNIDKKAILQAQQARRIPFHIRKKVKESLKELERQHIIEPLPANQPTPLLSPIVTVPKKWFSAYFC